MNAVKSLYPLVDALQIPLETKKDKAKGFAKFEHPLGPVVLDFDVKVESDFLTEACSGLMAHWRGDLWLYFISVEKIPNSPSFRLFMVVFDGKNEDFKSLKRGSVAETFSVIIPRAAAAFEFNDKWIQINGDNLPIEEAAQRIITACGVHGQPASAIASRSPDIRSNEPDTKL